MTAIRLLVALVAISLGIAGPLVFAHYGRSPTDRLEKPMLAVVVFVPHVIVAAVLSSESLPVPDLNLLGFVLSATFGVFAGLFGLAVYGVLERLVLPRAGRSGTNSRSG